MRNEPKGVKMTVDVKERLETLREVCEEIKGVEIGLDVLRDTKWEIVRELKDAGHDFTATSEGMNIVLSSSPSFNWS